MKYLSAAVLAVFIIGILFYKPLTTHLKILLFITEQFPQIPIKPLGLVSLRPFQEKVELKSKNGKILGDLFLPVKPNKKPAVILAMGVKTSEKDKPLLYHFADSMARLGYVTIWPRLETLDRGMSLPEEPETFIESFKYLATLPQTDSKRITFVGFSVGSSIAFVASAEPDIRDLVHGLVFFGGYFDIFEYLQSLASKTVVIDGSTIPWDPDSDATSHAKSLLEAKGADQVLKIFDAKSASEAAVLLNEVPEDETLGLKRFSPQERLDQFKAGIFILHDKSDSFVPYVESIKLDQALSGRSNKTFLITDLFEHVQPNRPINMGELVKLYGFLYKVFSFL